MVRAYRFAALRLLRGAVAALAMVIATTGLGLDRANAANQGIVTAQDGQFVLNGAPFRFVGTNAYFLHVGAAEGAFGVVDDTMSVMSGLGMKVLRIWAFGDGSSYGQALQPAPGVYDESKFRALDYVLSRADQAGIRLILVLVNHWTQFGGMPQYVQWCAPGSSVDVFYTNPTCRDLYKRYASHVLNRVNTYNGRPYKTDPTIFAWELANEPGLGDGADTSGQTVRNWVAEMAAHLKSIDPNHMVGTGEEGYDTTSSGYSPVSQYNNQAYLFNGWKGVSFTQNTAVADIDFGSIHLYPEYWNFSAGSGATWVRDHARIARSLGKPLLFGEFGHSTNAGPIYDSWLAATEAEQVGGSLVWQLMCPSCARWADQFGVVYPPTGAVSDVLARYAALANATSGGGGGPSFTIGTSSATPTPVSPGQTLTATTSVTAGSAASNIVVDVDIQNGAGTRVAGQSFSGQSFTAGQTRPYSVNWAVPAGQATGAYRMQVTVHNGPTNFATSNPAASFSVGTSAPPPPPPPTTGFTVGATSASPNPVSGGQTVTVSTSITGSAAASGIIVDLNVFNASGTRVAQQVYSGQSFSAGQTRPYAWNWPVPAGQVAGTYTVKVGVFGAGWAPTYTWINQAATFAVNAPAVAPMGFTVGATTASPQPVRRGQILTVDTTITGGAASGIIVNFEIYDAAGTRVARKAYTGERFGAGETRAFSWKWRVPSRQGLGTYTVRVGVFSAHWSSRYTESNPAATFAVQPKNGEASASAAPLPARAPTTITLARRVQPLGASGTPSWTPTAGEA